MGWLLVVVGLCTGCDVVFGLDGRPSDNAVPTCGTTEIDDNFTGTGACNPWGVPFPDAKGISVGNGRLAITPPDAAAGGCASNGMVTLAEGGVMIEVERVLVGEDAYTALQLIEADVAITVVNDKLLVSSLNNHDFYAKEDYDETAMQWWRLRPDRSNGTMVAAYSQDGINWEKLGAVPRSLPAAAKVVIIAGFNVPTPSNTARFKHLRACK